MSRDEKRYLTTVEVAEIYQISVHTLRKWRSDGRGPRFGRVGPNKYGPVRYTREDVDNYLRFEGGEES